MTHTPNAHTDRSLPGRVSQQAVPAVCPMHQAAAPRAFPAPDDELVLPMNRRIVTHYATSEAGATELRLYAEHQDIHFDDPAEFAFGETLARQSRFQAGAATQWGPGYPWPQVQGWLADLLNQGVLRTGAESPPQPLVTGARPAPLPPGPCAQPRSWTEGPALMQALTGRPLETGWLELVLPIFRVVHAALDTDGRQVGEANVFPKALRLDVPTQWRACIYPGTRFQVEQPMNVTALKAMRQHWGAMMSLLSAVRAAYLQRFPKAQAGWTVGDLERLSSAVLALPTWLLMRADQPVANGDLHPALSSLFRVTDGLRMVMHQMLFVPNFGDRDEPTRPADAPITRAEILAYAERNHSFHSEHGVCAGPQAMVDEFLTVVVDGWTTPCAEIDTLHPDVQHALGQVDAAMDYAFLGLQGHAAVFTLWPVMARSYERLAEAAGRWAQHGGPAVQALNTRLQGHLQSLQARSYLGQEPWRAEREAVYADMYAQCAAGLAPRGLAGGEANLPGQLGASFSCLHAQADQRLEAALQRQLCRADGSDLADARALRDRVMEFLLRTQAVLGVAVEAQTRLNRHLGRAAPQRAFDAADLNLHNHLLAAAPTRLPYLLDELQALFGLRIQVDAEHLRIDLAESEAAASPALPPHSTDTVSAETRA